MTEKKKAIVHISSLVLALVLVSSSLSIPTQINSYYELSRVQLGLPLKFYSQDLRYLDPYTYPQSYAIQNIAKSHPRINLFNLLISYLTIFLLIEFIFWTIHIKSHHLRRKYLALD